MTDDFGAFIRARLDEDERIARTTTPVPVPGAWQVGEEKYTSAPLTIKAQDELEPDYEGYGTPVILLGADWTLLPNSVCAGQDRSDMW